MTPISPQPPSSEKFGKVQKKATKTKEALLQAIKDGSKISFKRKAYSDFKKFLYKTHKFKCAYCETDIRNHSGDVEHYRPKSEIRKYDSNKKEDHPGYYWTAYDWQNFLLSCSDCNRRFKRCYFPISGERVVSHNTNVDLDEVEKPLILNPTKTDPKEHLSIDDTGSLIGLSEVGLTTIAVMDLDREYLIEKRQAAIERGNDAFKLLQDAINEKNSTKIEARKKNLRRIVFGADEFSLASAYGLLGAILNWQKHNNQSYDINLALL